MTARHLRDQSLASGAASAEPRHVGLRPGFVDENQPSGGDFVLVPPPLPPPPRDVGAILFAGVEAFFKAETNMAKEVPDAVITDVDPALVQFRQQFAAGEIRLLRDAGTYPCLFFADPEGLLAAHRQRRRPPVLGLPFAPAHRPSA